MIANHFSYTFLLYQIIIVISDFRHTVVVAKAIDHNYHHKELRLQQINSNASSISVGDGDDDHRSCEILASKQFFPPLTFTIFVQASRRCPDEFLDLTEADVKAVLGDDIQRILWNGFRKVIFDDNLYEGNLGGTPATNNIQILTFGPDAIPFFEMGELEITGPSGSTTYEASRVERKVIPMWQAGKTIYELIAPNCSAVYVLQTMWIGGRDGDWGMRNESELETLKLDLPEGWIYQYRILTEDLVVPLVNGTAVVLTDSARNAYSEVENFDPAIVCPRNSQNNDIDLDDENLILTSSPVKDNDIHLNDETSISTSSSVISTEATSAAGARFSTPFITLILSLMVVEMML